MTEELDSLGLRRIKIEHLPKGGLIMPKTLSLGEFVKQLTALFENSNMPIPFKNEKSWHYLFYELKKDRNAIGRPAFFNELEFDWDGPFPKSQELSDFLHSLHWNASVSASNPHYETINLSKEVKNLWFKRYEELDGNTKQFFALVLERAEKEFGASRAKKAHEVARKAL
jgi:hypothetical protein